jgi:hypothetical protein
MTPAVVDALAALKDRGYLSEDGDLVFCNTAGARVDSWALRRRFYVAIKRAGLRRIRFHDLRHAFGTAAIGVLDAYRVQSHGTPALLDDAAIPAPQAEASGCSRAACGVRRGRVPRRVPNRASPERTERNSADLRPL